MPRVARLPEWDRVRSDEAGPRAANLHRLKYYAFLSYSHADEDTADWLHGALERFRTPGALTGRLTDNGVIPRRLTPIFRDRHELPASQDLAAGIREALDGSRFLIVLCSPAAAASRWVNAEIDMFKRHSPDGCVLAAILSGEPFASDIPGREAEECLPPALRHKYDRRGRPTARPAEPLAADLRDHRDGKRLGLLKLIAGMLGVGLDELVQRETLRRQRRLAIVAAASLAGMAVTSTLAIFALESRDEARDQRREAEGLVGFMLGDLRDKLEPVGRLDALDAVGSHALAYYQKQDKSSLPDEALAQRSRALSLLAEIATLRGDFDGALRRYDEAMAGTAEMVRRAPDDPQRLFDHAQNVFYVSSIARQRGQMARAETALREYKRLADRMVAIDPDNRKWRMETQYAAANLGIALFEQRRFPEASRQFQEALNTIEQLAAAEPRNSDYQKSVAESLAWLADSERAEGRLDEAIGQRERQVALLNHLMGGGASDVEYKQKAIPAYQALGRLFASKGELDQAIEQLRLAVSHAEELIPTEPGNTKWREFAASARLALAETLLAKHQTDEAASQTRAGCDLVSGLIARDRSVVSWRGLARSCLTMRARIALVTGAKGEALSLANQALASAKSAKWTDRVDERYTIAGAYRLVGDIDRQIGDQGGARSAWLAGLAILPRGIKEKPAETSERAELLQRVGRTDEAKQLKASLETIGYRRPG